MEPGDPCAGVDGSDGPLRSAVDRAASWLQVVPFRWETLYERGADDELPVRGMGDGRVRAAVVSFPENTGDERIDRWLVPTGRSYVYDDALVALALLRRGDATRAAAILETLASLQGEDGSIGYSFSTRDDPFYNRSYVRTGAVAWVGYAMAMFERVTGDRRFRGSALLAARWVLRQRVDPEDERDPRAGLLLGGRGRWTPDYASFLPDFVLDVAIMEHQIDAWFLLDLLAEQTGDPGLRRDALALSEAMEARLWQPETGRFAVGADRDGPIADEALDAAGSWAALWLLARGEPQRVPALLDQVEARFGVRRGLLVGHRPYAGAVADHGVDWSLIPTIWSEGTLGVALARLRSRAPGRARVLLGTASKLQCAGGTGGVPVASLEAPDLTVGAGAGPTAWFVLVGTEVLEGPAPGSVWALAGVGGIPYTSRTSVTVRGR